jgi:hypothetical protein
MALYTDSTVVDNSYARQATQAMKIESFLADVGANGSLMT